MPPSRPPGPTLLAQSCDLDHGERRHSTRAHMPLPHLRNGPQSISTGRGVEDGRADGKAFCEKCHSMNATLLVRQTRRSAERTRGPAGPRGGRVTVGTRASVRHRPPHAAVWIRAAPPASQPIGNANGFRHRSSEVSQVKSEWSVRDCDRSVGSVEVLKMARQVTGCAARALRATIRRSRRRGHTGSGSDAAAAGES